MLFDTNSRANKLIIANRKCTTQSNLLPTQKLRKRWIFKLNCHTQFFRWLNSDPAQISSNCNDLLGNCSNIYVIYNTSACAVCIGHLRSAKILHCDPECLHLQVFAGAFWYQISWKNEKHASMQKTLNSSTWIFAFVAILCYPGIRTRYWNDKWSKWSQSRCDEHHWRHRLESSMAGLPMMYHSVSQSASERRWWKAFHHENHRLHKNATSRQPPNAAVILDPRKQRECILDMRGSCTYSRLWMDW